MKRLRLQVILYKYMMLAVEVLNISTKECVDIALTNVFKQMQITIFRVVLMDMGNKSSSCRILF